MKRYYYYYYYSEIVAPASFRILEIIVAVITDEFVYSPPIVNRYFENKMFGFPQRKRYIYHKVLRRKTNDFIFGDDSARVRALLLPRLVFRI